MAEPTSGWSNGLNSLLATQCWKCTETASVAHLWEDITGGTRCDKESFCIKKIGC